MEFEMTIRTASAILFAFGFVFLFSDRSDGQTKSQSSVETTQSNQKPQSTGQTEKQVRQTLESFRRVNDHPLFEMHFHGDYVADTPRKVSATAGIASARWACSIFVSYGPDGSAIYGRNFDWQHNPALLLHTNPSNAYASISMVDISYLGFERQDEKYKTVEGRKALLSAPMLPFDGMNEHGLTVGMAAVGDTKIPLDPKKTNVGSLQIIRLMLDRAKNVEEAISVFNQFNILKSGGPNIHYLIGDIDGKSALIELKDDKTNIMRGNKNWQSATNFYLTGQEKPLQQCARFAQIHRMMSDKNGCLSVDQSFNLLKNASQRSTQWTVVYDMANRSAHVATDRNFNKRSVFKVKNRPHKDLVDNQDK
jgi:predicted choloylglycine hydrolase